MKYDGNILYTPNPLDALIFISVKKQNKKLSGKFNIVILQYNNITMGATKTDHFSDRQNDLAVLAKALGHPARIAIMEYLLSVDSCICGDIVDELPLAQPTVSQHLKELKNAGLIKGSIEGKSICYCINETGIEKIKSFFQHITDHLEKKRNECC